MRVYSTVLLFLSAGMTACAPPPAASPSSGAAAAAPSRLCKAGATYCEDFAAVGEGELPTGWHGGDGLAVKVVGGRKVLAPFAPRERYVVTMPDWRASGDFRIDMLMRTSARNSTGMISERASYSIRAGSLKLTLVTDWGKAGITLNDSGEELDVGNIDNASVMVSLLREGDVCRVFVNSQQILIARFHDEATIDGVTLVVSHAGKDFAVQAISLTDTDAGADRQTDAVKPKPDTANRGKRGIKIGKECLENPLGPGCSAGSSEP